MHLLIIYLSGATLQAPHKTKHGFRTYCGTRKMALYKALTFWIAFDFLNFYFAYSYVRMVDTTKEESILSCTDHWSGSPTAIGKLRCMRPNFSFQEVTIERPCWRPHYTYMYTISRTAHTMWWAFLLGFPRKKLLSQITIAFCNIWPCFCNQKSVTNFYLFLLS